MFLRSSGGRRSKTPSGSAPFARRERPSRRKETPRVSAFCLFGGGKRKDGRGMKKESASSKIRWKKTREVQKLRRAKAPLRFER
jgi:hypothetical protein